jgi:flagellar basal-body rod modification protein FlgD
MSTVSATSSATSSSTSASSSTSSTSSTNSLSYNDFLTLLLAEMKNQDPTSPMDASAMVSQLATISQVGQAVQTNTTLASLLTSSQLTQAEIGVGETISGPDATTSTKTDSGTVTSISVTSSGSTATLSNGDSVTVGNGVTVQ